MWTPQLKDSINEKPDEFLSLALKQIKDASKNVNHSKMDVESKNKVCQNLKRCLEIITKNA